MKRKLILMIGAAEVVLATIFGAPHAVVAQEEETLASADLGDMSLEELMGIEVYSVAKKKQKLADTAAAAYVLTQEDIRRSGVTTVPEALRLVPGVEVAHIDSNKWAITIRGFNERFANKLLVLIDGRSVYTPLFAGVYWDIQDVVLEDIDRIEVIRGPGGTLWGANAVNGVINIITKSSKDTQGLLLTAGKGTEEEGFATARYGAKLTENAHLRVYAKYFDHDDFQATAPRLEGDDAADNWHLTNGGFRSDWEPSESDTFTLQGDTYAGNAGSLATVATLAPPFTDTEAEQPYFNGGNVLGRWTHRFAGGSETQFQAYYDRTDRDSRPPTINENRNTGDLDFQHRLRLGERHDVVWGLGYRVTWDEIPDSFSLQFDPEQRTSHLVSALVQDEISLLDDSLRVTIGTKLEHNDFTGLEWQPNLRALWKIHEHHTVWGAVSRAVRTPSRAEDDIRINGQVIPPGVPGTPCETSPLTCVVSFFGDTGFDSEQLLALEAGYRAQVRENLSFDLATFYNIYDELRTSSLGTPFVEGAQVTIPVNTGNGMDAVTWGFEIAADWRPIEFWTLRSGYTFLEMDLDLDDEDQQELVTTLADGSSPQNQAFVRSLLDLPMNFELDTNFKWVDELKSLDVDPYVTLDVRIGWRPTEMLEFSLVGQNLLEKSNQEFNASAFVADEPTRVERSVYGKVTVRY